LIDALRRHRASAPEGLLRALLDEVRAFSPHEQQDDITMIVARRRAVPATARPS
jgi:serine phosphatase RsbU (regulator of sigma subunit)